MPKKVSCSIGRIKRKINTAINKALKGCEVRPIMKKQSTAEIKHNVKKGKKIVRRRKAHVARRKAYAKRRKRPKAPEPIMPHLNPMMQNVL